MLRFLDSMEIPLSCNLVKFFLNDSHEAVPNAVPLENDTIFEPKNSINNTCGKSKKRQTSPNLANPKHDH